MSIERLISGFKSFRGEYFETARPQFSRLVKEGQNPKVCVVACSDSRVDPAIVLQAEPGDIFSIRNVANLVPPCKADNSHHGTSAALEFAVTGLEVENVIIFGHAHCAGIDAMIKSARGESVPGEFVQPWTDIATEAHVRALAEMPDADDSEHARCCEKNAVLVSMENLMTFPFVAERVNAGTLALHGWYFDIAEGTLLAYDPATKTFAPIG